MGKTCTKNSHKNSYCKFHKRTKQHISIVGTVGYNSAWSYWDLCFKQLSGFQSLRRKGRIFDHRPGRPKFHWVDQHRMLFYEAWKRHNSILLRVLSKICHNEMLSVAAKCAENCLNVSAAGIKLEIWESCAATCISFCCNLLYVRLCIFIYICGSVA